MPEYTYKCDDCNITHNIRKSMKLADNLLICTECGKEMHIVITGGSGVLFKGEGFHCTDYTEKEMYNVDNDFE